MRKTKSAIHWLFVTLALAVPAVSSLTTAAPAPSAAAEVEDRSELVDEAAPQACPVFCSTDEFCASNCSTPSLCRNHRCVQF